MTALMIAVVVMPHIPTLKKTVVNESTLEVLLVCLGYLHLIIDCFNKLYSRALVHLWAMYHKSLMLFSVNITY